MTIRVTTKHLAEDIAVRDSGGFFVSSEVEDALQEVGTKRYYSSPINMHGVGTNVPASTSNYYLSPFETGLQTTARRFFALRDGVLKNLFLQLNGTQPASGSLVATVEVESVDTALTVTVAAGSTTGTYSDTVHQVAVTQGDKIILRFDNNAGGTSINVNACGYEFLSTLESL